MFKLLLTFLFDRRGEIPGQGSPAPGTPGQGGAPSGKPGGDGGQGASGGAPAGDADAGAGSGGPGGGAAGDPPAPKFGKYESAEALWAAHQALQSKTTQTERRLAGMNKSLESMGFRVEQDPQTGDFRYVEINANKPKEPTKTKRFNDAHKAMFDEPVLTAIEARVQDIVEEMIEKSFSDYENKGKERQTTVQQKIAAGQKLVKLFPSLKVPEGAKNVDGEWVFADGKPDPNFNPELYALATEIWRSNKAYFENPQGELFAAMEAAMELGIAPQAIGAAKAAGFKEGVENKKILSPVSGSGQKKEIQPGQMSKEDYMKLSPEEKEKYDKAALQIK